MDMLEKVARAIDAVQLWTRHIDHGSDPVWQVCRYGTDDEPRIVVLSQSVTEPDVYAFISKARARAAIYAIRKPTQAMLDVEKKAETLVEEWSNGPHGLLDLQDAIARAIMEAKAEEREHALGIVRGFREQYGDTLTSYGSGYETACSDIDAALSSTRESGE